MIYAINSVMPAVDSKIDDNGYELIQVLGVLYRYVSWTASDCSYIFTVIYLFL